MIVTSTPLAELGLAEPPLHLVRLRATENGEPVAIERLPSPLRLVGRGADAVVVQHPQLPEYAFKIYGPGTVRHLDDEYHCYERLAGSSFFPVCFGRGDSYLVLSYEDGPTLYQCLERGIPVPEQVIEDVEAARLQARGAGLHPKDVHLRNVLVQEGRAKLVDVAKYALPGDEDPVWDHLALAYRSFYPFLRGRKIPVWAMELTRRRYRAERSDEFSVEAFGGRMLHLLDGFRSGRAADPPSA